MPRRRGLRRAGSMREQRRRGVEAERLRERVAGDVDHDAGERERGAEADAERDHAHVLEARVGEQPLPRQRAPEERHGDGERDQPEADEHGARSVARRPTGASVSCTRQATSSTVGSSAAESSAETGAGASQCASGSQLCTGAQPILAARPASSSTNAISAGCCGHRVRRGAEARASRAPAGRGGRRWPGRSRG